MHAGGAESYTFTYNADGTTTVTGPLGYSRVYTFINPVGVIRLASITGEACAQCGLEETSYNFDNNGFLVNTVDANGNVTTYDRDGKGREISRIEAYGTVDARTINTVWHDQFDKPSSIQRPGKLTSYSYDQNGRLLGTTVTAQP